MVFGISTSQMISNFMKHPVYISSSQLLDVVECLSICQQQATLDRNVPIKRSIYWHFPGEDGVLLTYGDCTTSNGFELDLMRCGAMLLLLIIYIYICEGVWG